MSDAVTGTVQNVCNMTGTFYHAVDAKGRINFPAKLREALGVTFWLVKGISDKCLTVYSQAGWDDLMLQLRGFKGSDAEWMRRWLCANAIEVTPDKQGRILIPTNLREYAGLDADKEVAVIGAGKKAEIWSRTLWTEMESGFDPSASPLLAELCL